MEKYIDALGQITGSHYGLLEKIWRHFGDFAYAWERAGAAELRLAGASEEYIAELLRKRAVLDLGRRGEALWQADIVLVGRENPEFPVELRQIAAPPFLIYRRGADLRTLTNRVAMVGMRKATVQGEKLAFGTGRVLAEAGLTVVSGLAFGIDAAAHNGVVRAGGKTIAVLASGIARVTPSSHDRLAREILACGGAIISEYPITAPALKFQFMERNRLIAGLCHTVVIVEAARRSGALITARHALEQGKEILAFPGDPGRVQTAGCNALIRQGEAGLVDSVSDILENLRVRNLLGVNSVLGRRHGPPLSMEEASLYELIRLHSPISTDQLAEKIKSPAGQLLAGLGLLEMYGLIQKNSGMMWQASAN